MGQSGNLRLRNIHNESYVAVYNEGNVNLKMADNHPVKLCVTGKKIDTDVTFSNYGEVVTKEDEYQHYFGTVQPDKFSPLCQVIADQGDVKISSQHWAQSLGLKLKK